MRITIACPEALIPDGQDLAMVPSLERLHELFRYNAETGNLIRRIHVSSNARAGDVAGTVSRHGYLQVSIDKKLYHGHRIIWRMVKGEIPVGMCIDHIDNDKLNNKLENLRLATMSNNNCNRSMSSNNTSGLKGASYERRSGKFQSHIKINGKQMNLGLFDTVELAHQAYCKAAVVHHGEFANFGRG